MWLRRKASGKSSLKPDSDQNHGPTLTHPNNNKKTLSRKFVTEKTLALYWLLLEQVSFLLNRVLGFLPFLIPVHKASFWVWNNASLFAGIKSVHAHQIQGHAAKLDAPGQNLLSPKNWHIGTGERYRKIQGRGTTTVTKCHRGFSCWFPNWLQHL